MWISARIIVADFLISFDSFYWDLLFFYFSFLSPIMQPISQLFLNVQQVMNVVFFRDMYPLCYFINILF